jgi:DNA-binding response OmpR family regulator
MKKTGVLIIDDEQEFGSTLAERLQLRGYDAKAIYSADNALSVIAEMKPDIILLDLRLPGVRGIEILMTIRDFSPGIEIILLTGHVDHEHKIQGLRLDAFNYIIKPFDMSELIDKLEKAREGHAGK